ncbi:MAG: adenine-specific methyltransferase EcoRI family protein [Mycoplasma sp.]
MSKNNNLKAARLNKNDEFYTQLLDIEKEMVFYKEHFKNKIIYCNCDNQEQSNFFNFFKDNFNQLELKKLITTNFNPNQEVFKVEYENNNITKTKLNGDGDFKSEECIEILNQSDIIITNPPFSLLRSYLKQLLTYQKKFLIIAPESILAYREVFLPFKEQQFWRGVNKVKNFVEPNNNIKTFGNICWYTNLHHNQPKRELNLTESYDSKKYPHYENYGAINVDKIKNIPKDYNDVIGVPLSFIDYHNPKQFEIVALSTSGLFEPTKYVKMEVLKNGTPTNSFTTNAKSNLFLKWDESIKKPITYRDVNTNQIYYSNYSRLLIKKV